MNDKISTYYKSFSGKKVTFLGAGVTNRPLIVKFSDAGAIVTVHDKADKNTLGDFYDKMSKNGVNFILGENYLDGIDADVVFRSPGINFNSPQLIELRKKGVEITSEMEEFFKFCPAKIYAVTGSDGKTTTTTLISEILKASGKKVFLGGNIGTPLLPMVEDMNDGDCAVVELSSFQLISMQKGPAVAVVTNVSPNHLDVHKDMQEYIDAKRNILLYQDKNSRTVLNLMNEITKGFKDDVKGDLLHFSRTEKPTKGTYCDDKGDIYYVNGNDSKFIINAADIRIPGLHNVENFLAAIGAVYGDVQNEDIVKVAREFGGVEHRIEFVRELDTVRWYNDSIATSPTRAVAGLRAFDRKLIIIAGGYDKHIPFDVFAREAVDKIKILILCGDTAQKIQECVESQPEYKTCGLTIYHVDNMQQAVDLARKVATDNDIVSLSPACASFDQYKNFAVRGNHFKELVMNLK